MRQKRPESKQRDIATTAIGTRMIEDALKFQSAIDKSILIGYRLDGRKNRFETTRRIVIDNKDSS